MSTYIFRNYTVEYLFPVTYVFSGYGDVSIPQNGFDDILIFYHLNPVLTPGEQIVEIEDIKLKIKFIIDSGIKSRIIIFNLFRESKSNWQSKKPELLTAIDNFNNEFLIKLALVNKNIKIIDLNSFLVNQSISILDWRFWFTSQIFINPKLSKKFIEWFDRKKDAIDFKRKKCLILDCDNTLWGGVVGEDGTHGIRLGLDYPGNCFFSFQKLLLELSKNGVVIALCSKNNLNDVEDVWRLNSNNLINDQIISAYRINWQDKASNIKSIAEELNIGTDSLVFFDDNPIERELVKKVLPEVEVPNFPDKPYELVSFFWDSYDKYFSTYELTSEDLKKSNQYKENFFRNESKKIFANLDDYLSNLEIEIDIIKANESNLGRIAQMTQKTNQFNLTTKRYTEGQLRILLENDAKIFCAHVRDKFGDNGITVSAIIIKDNDEDLIVDSYLLSCRILGREIEKVVLLKILEIVDPDGVQTIYANYIPSPKNSLVSEFLETVGFKLIEIQPDGLKKYIYDSSKETKIKNHYQITIKNN